MNGVSVQSHLGSLASEMIPSLYHYLEVHLRCALAGKSVSAVEFAPPPAEGHADEAFLVSCLPAFHEAGEVVGISVTVVNNTDRRRMEVALWESEDHYRGLTGKFKMATNRDPSPIDMALSFLSCNSGPSAYEAWLLPGLFS